MDLTTAFWYAAGLILLLIALQALATPLQVAAKVVASSVIGGLSLWALNLAGGIFGFHLGVNPVSAVLVGMLGAPGVVGLSVMSLILG